MWQAYGILRLYISSAFRRLPCIPELPTCLYILNTKRTTRALQHRAALACYMPTALACPRTPAPTTARQLTVVCCLHDRWWRHYAAVEPLEFEPGVTVVDNFARTTLRAHACLCAAHLLLRCTARGMRRARAFCGDVLLVGVLCQLLFRWTPGSGMVTNTPRWWPPPHAGMQHCGLARRDLLLKTNVGTAAVSVLVMYLRDGRSCCVMNQNA